MELNAWVVTNVVIPHNIKISGDDTCRYNYSICFFVLSHNRNLLRVDSCIYRTHLHFTLSFPQYQNLMRWFLCSVRLCIEFFYTLLCHFPQYLSLMRWPLYTEFFYTLLCHFPQHQNLMRWPLYLELLHFILSFSSTSKSHEMTPVYRTLLHFTLSFSTTQKCIEKVYA